MLIWHAYEAAACRSGLEGLNNGMMASAPGLPLWGVAAEVLQERLHATGVKDYERGPIYQTGPRVLGEVHQPCASWRIIIKSHDHG